MNPTIQRFNRLVEEFDERTNYRFDKITDTDDLVLIASLWPRCREGMAAELVMAADEAKQKHLPDLDHCQECGEVCPKGWRICPECHARGYGKASHAGRDDWRADR